MKKNVHLNLLLFIIITCNFFGMEKRLTPRSPLRHKSTLQVNLKSCISLYKKFIKTKCYLTALKNAYSDFNNTLHQITSDEAFMKNLQRVNKKSQKITVEKKDKVYTKLVRNMSKKQIKLVPQISSTNKNDNTLFLSTVIKIYTYTHFFEEQKKIREQKFWQLCEQLYRKKKECDISLQERGLLKTMTAVKTHENIEIYQLRDAESYCSMTYPASDRIIEITGSPEQNQLIKIYYSLIYPGHYNMIIEKYQNNNSTSMILLLPVPVTETVTKDIEVSYPLFETHSIAFKKKTQVQPTIYEQNNELTMQPSNFSINPEKYLNEATKEIADNLDKQYQKNLLRYGLSKPL